MSKRNKPETVEAVTLEVIAPFVQKIDEADTSKKETAGNFKAKYIDKKTAEQIEAVRVLVIKASTARYFEASRTIGGKVFDTAALVKVRDAVDAAKGVKLSDTQKKYRKAVQDYCANVWAYLKNGGVKPSKAKAKSGKTEASKASTSGAVTESEGAGVDAVVQGQGITAEQLAVAVHNWLVLHKDLNDRGDLMRELERVLKPFSENLQIQPDFMSYVAA